VITGGGNYYIRSNLGRFIDITDGVFAQGTNIQSCKFNGTTAQKWKLVKEDISKFKPAMPNVTISGSNGNATISWNSVDTAYKNKYDVRIYDVNKGLNNYIKVAWGVNGTSYTTNLPAGSYGVTVAAVDKIDSNIYSNAKMIRFTIDENGKVEQEKKPDDPIDPANPVDPSTPDIDPNQRSKDGTAIGEGASAAVAEKAIMTMNNDNDLPGAVYSKLRLRSPKQTKKSISLKWTKVNKASKYVIYGNKCGNSNKPQKLTTVNGNTKTFKKVKGKKLKKGTYYKFIIVALDKNNKVVSTSKIIHVATKGGKVGNHKSVTVKKSVISKAKKLKKGKSLKLSGKAVPQSLKLKVKKHVEVRYESTNKKIATVSKNGVVKAKKKGSCYVYAYAQNGVYKKIKVVVR